MSSGAGFPSVSSQDLVLSTIFSSAMLGILLLGIYAAVYFGTLYIYLTKKSARNFMVLAAITIMFMSTVATVSGQWVMTKAILSMTGQPKATIFIYALNLNGDGWNVLLNAICWLVLSSFADGLLIWRCYNVWDKSFRVIFIPLLFLLGEIGLNLSNIIIASLNHLDPIKPSVITRLNHIFSSGYFMTVGATLLTTLLIVYRIHSVMRYDGLKRSHSSFHHILELLLQSAAPYAVLSFMYAIEGAIPENTEDMNSKWVLYVTQNYTSTLLIITAGMAPTVMVARVALASSGTVVHGNSGGISAIEFQAQSAGLATSHIFVSHHQVGESSDEIKSSQVDEIGKKSDTLAMEIS